MKHADAYIFDLDGTLIDNMHVHAEAFAEFARANGLPPLTEAMRLRLDGKRNRDIFPVLFDRHLDDAEIARYTHEKESLYRRLSKGRLVAVAGLTALLDRLTERGIPVAIATSAPTENVTHSLAESGLRDRFSVIVRGDEVPRGKPHPDVFLEAARLVGADPRRCTAFEDAPAGLDAARAAGMRTVALTTSFSSDLLIARSAPDLVIRDYDGFLATVWNVPVPARDGSA